MSEDHIPPIPPHIRELWQQISAITARLDRLEGVPQPATTAVWINYRPPNESDGPWGDPRVWRWGAAGAYATPIKDVKHGQWWASGLLEKPDVAPPRFFPFTPEEFAAACSALPPEPAPTGWITDRVPEEGDGDRPENVQVPPRDGGRGVCIVHYLGVYPGTPWAPINDNPPPWDPTTLDRNGWIRSRLPTVGDTSQRDHSGYAGQVLIPAGDGYDTATIHHLLIVPGQPWAPCGSEPGPYQP